MKGFKRRAHSHALSTTKRWKDEKQLARMPRSKKTPNFVRSSLLKNETGSTLVIVIMLLFFMSIVGFSLLTLNSNSMKLSKNEENYQAVYYIAEAGLTVAGEQLQESFKKIENDAHTQLNGKLQALAQQNTSCDESCVKNLYKDILQKDYFTETKITHYIYPLEQVVQIAPEKKADVTYILEEESLQNFAILIKSQGFIGDIKTRTLQQYIQLDSELFDYLNSENTTGGTSGSGGTATTPGPSPFENFGAVISGDIKLEGSAKIEGHATSIGGTVTLGWSTPIQGNVGSLNGTVNIPQWANLGNIISGAPFVQEPVNLQEFLPAFPHEKFAQLAALPVPNNLEVALNPYNKANIIDNGNLKATNYITNNYTLQLTGDTKFKRFEVSSNNNLTIDVGDQDIDLYIEDLAITQGHVKVIGTGKLNLYVTKYTALKGSFNKNGDNGKVNLYYNGTSPLTLNNETQFYGSLINNTADITLGGGAGVYGNILSGGTKILINGDVPSDGQYIIAPNADVKLEGSGRIKGVLIAKNLHAIGGTSITFGEPLLPLPSGSPPAIPEIPEGLETDIKEYSTIVEI